MHWIMVGILIWIGLAIAPVVIGAALIVIPFVFFVGVGAILGFQITEGAGGAWMGGLLGACVAYKLIKALTD